MALFLTNFSIPWARADALTYKYNNARDGANTNETILTPANVNVGSFARLFSYTVDGYLYAQPLYVSNVQIPGQGTHNVVFVATENDTIYAFDADSNLGANGGLLWKTNLGTALVSTFYGVRYHHNVLNPLIGITGTPAIDTNSGTLYIDVFSGVVSNTASGFHTLHALNITNGTEQANSPVLVTASVPGNGVDAVNGVVTFAPQNQMNRPAMTLVGGILYASYGSYGDTDPYHGWVIGFSTTNLQQLTNYAFATTPNARMSDFGINAGEGALWMGGDGLCADSQNNLYLESGNGSFSAFTNGGDYGDSFVKLSTTNGFAVADYFTPWNQSSMDVNDQDLGSGGAILLPDSVGSSAHRRLIIGGGKEGTLYLQDRDNMGHFNSANDNQIVQELKSAIGGLFGSGAYFNNWIYFQGTSDRMKAFSITNAVMSTTPVSTSTPTLGYLGYTPTISANGTSNGIAWVIQADAYANNGPAVLHAYNATNLAQELYNSSQNLARDNPGGAVKYSVPIVANGKVFVGTEFALSIYGIGIFLPSPVISPNGGVFTNSVIVSLTDATNAATIYYTLNGTTPTTNSFVYTGPFQVTNSGVLSAMAVMPGAFNSPVASAAFVDSSELGSGTGLTGNYWTNTTSAAFTNVNFSAVPTLTRTDAVVNFNWSTNGPTPTIGRTNYVVRWTGCVQPQFTEPYTFYTTANAGVRLYVNGRLLIDNWVAQSATTRSNTVTLAGQQLYNIQLDYFYGTTNAGGSQVSLSWGGPSTPQAIIPQSQLYPYTNPPPTIVLTSPADGSAYTAVATVSAGAEADAPYNPIAKVDFYANDTLLGTLTNSVTAPLYTLTRSGFVPNPGGETAVSSEARATPLAIASLTTTNVEPQGVDWTAAIWKTNGAGTAVPPAASNAYSLVFNGVPVGNNLNNTRVRSPDVDGVQTFPGGSLTVNKNTELRSKHTPTTINFPGVGGKPGLVVDGGLLNVGQDGGVATIAGSVEVRSQSYNSAQGANGGGGGLAPLPRQFIFACTFSGKGNMVIINCSTNVPQVVSGTGNTFSGQWIVQCGWLQGATANSLGTNSIIVDPFYNGYLADLPNATSPNGPALFEVNYNLNCSGTLILANGGQMNLHQNCTFTAVTINGVSLAPGTHPYSELVSNFPGAFLPGGSGSLAVIPAPLGAPGSTAPPTGLTAIAGNGLVNISWTPSAGATNYYVKRSTVAGGPYTNIASVVGTTYTDSGLANGITYFYVVSAVSPPGYVLTAVATDGSGLSSTSAPVHLAINSGSGAPYGLTNRTSVPAFLNLPDTVPAILPGGIPSLLSGTGAFADTANRVPITGLIPYVPNTPLWSDAAVKSRYLAVPFTGGLTTPDQQIVFAPTNSWTFPAGTVFVKNFDLVVNETNSSIPPRRLETRLLVRDINGVVYGVTYKWRPDNTDADLLTTSLNEDIAITNATGVRTQTWYYPSPADCLTCHTPVANYVLGVNTRQLNGSLTYPATGNTDNQLRTLNRLGLFQPSIDEAGITNYAQLAALTNLSASFEKRARSYLDANCAQCHQPGGVGITFDARFDTPPESQNITNYPAQLSLGIDRAAIIKGKDIWRSLLLHRMSTNDSSKMPTLARNVIDTNAVQVINDWINTVPGTQTLAPPAITPNGGTFNPSVSVTLQPPDGSAQIYYTLDGSLPTTGSLLYSGPFVLTNGASIAASAFEVNFDNSIAARAAFVFQPLNFTSSGFGSNEAFQMGFSGVAGNSYVLLTSTNLLDWTPLITNTATTNLFYLTDPGASNYPRRFYRVLQQ
ncbi:MAG TPA: chitobiase/beta-hexosaminidase C-terminal domain-containing protein [Verrucomicrobiae bacterium]|nr:chitobiase/beta-hexosaminidase C-terminal domain-containing protein [Verrucomicrobiae bacterium]